MFNWLDNVVDFFINLFSKKRKTEEYDPDNDTEVDWSDFEIYVKQANEEKSYQERIKKLREKNSSDTVSSLTIENTKAKYTSLDFIEGQEKKSKSKEKVYTTKQDNKANYPTTKSGNSLKTVKISNQLQKEVDIHIKKEINQYQTVSLEKLAHRIESNLKMLDDLILELKEYDQEYYSYIMKLEDLKYQSEGNKKILAKLKKEAPYYGSTIRAIVNHTGIVSELMDFA